jgi:bifunctional aspartokinase / homoserine dehydrogenase 1
MDNTNQSTSSPSMKNNNSTCTDVVAVDTNMTTLTSTNPNPNAVWEVHKFGGTSVANADCFQQVCTIIEANLLTISSNSNDTTTGTTTATTATRTTTTTTTATMTTSTSTTTNLAIVVSAMGGKPIKVTDLLLQSVQYASQRKTHEMNTVLQQIYIKHESCIHTLFRPPMTSAITSTTDEPNEEKEETKEEYVVLLQSIQKDIQDIRDILQTVSLMKWHSSRISELISGYGEVWSTQILALLLNTRQIQFQQQQQPQSQQAQPPQPHKFVYLDARRVITIDETNTNHQASISSSTSSSSSAIVCYDISQAKLQQVYDEEYHKIVLSSSPQQVSSSSIPKLHWVMTGYVASNTDGVATTLQRDGSDYSAAILGRLLQVSTRSITIWTDVDGILSADPRLVPLAQTVSDVSYNEAMELAYFGAKVLHPKTMQPAIYMNIPIYIRNTFRSSYPGSRIYTRSLTNKTSDQVVCAFSSIDHMAIVNVEGSGLIGVPGVAKRLFGTLERVGVNVVLISQASSEHSITFATTAPQANVAKMVIEEEFRIELEQNRISNVDVKVPCSIIAAVGDGMSSTTGCAGRFFSALGDAKINIIAIAQGCSERNISAVVQSNESVRALRAVHAAFRLSHTTVRIAIIGLNELGTSLLQLLDTQRTSIRNMYEMDLQVCVIVDHNSDTAKDSTSQQGVVCLQNDTDASADSITMDAYNKARSGGSHDSPSTIAKITFGGPESVFEYLWRSTCTNHILFDCTNDVTIGTLHAGWLRNQVDVVTANNTGLSGSKEQRRDIYDAEREHGKQSAKYLREVTVGGGLPVIKTLRSLLHSGDKIRRIDGIMSVSLSYILFRISPPPGFASCTEFDTMSSNGAFNGDLILPGTDKDAVGTAVSFSEAVKEAIALGLMEDDPTKDFNNEYTSRILMVLAIELGMAQNMEVLDIQTNSEKLLESILHKEVDYHNLSSEIDAEVKVRVDAARAKGCVVRHISSVDVRNTTVEIQIMDVPEHHIFAVTPPSCECVRFFTDRHRQYPLIVQGPSAGADSTASALLAEVLHLMRGKATPRSVALTRSSSTIASP